MLWSAEEMLDELHQRGDIAAPGHLQKDWKKMFTELSLVSPKYPIS